jgi:hypothetical protein
MGQLSMFLSRDIPNECEGVLCGNKFRYPSGIARSIVGALEAVSELVASTCKLAVVKADPCDNLVLECAAKAKADYMVSGDNYLLEMKRLEGVTILSPAQSLKVMA